MKIIRLEAENVKRLSAVAIEPDGNVVEISGDNGAGKTSVLDAIWWALAGKDAIQAKPVRRGAKSAHVILTLGDAEGTKMKVTRRWNEDGESTLKVEDATGTKQREPQQLLNSLLGALTLDPVSFQRMKPSDRLAVLKRLVPDFDFDAADDERQRLYDLRRIANTDAKRLKGVYDSTPPAPRDTPDKEIDTADVTRAISDAVSRATEYERVKGERAGIVADIERIEREAADFRAQATAREAAAAALRARMEKIEEPEAPPDISDAREALAMANTINANVRQKQARAKAGRDATAREADAEKLTADIEALDDRVRKAVESADLPVSGLALGTDDVYLRGVPFDQASDAEQLRASMAIAMAEQPTIRIIRVRDGSLLDAKGFAVIADVAKDDDWQVWVESVNPHGETAIIMQDGAVKE